MIDNRDDAELTPAAALRLEYIIIGFGILALLMIFQPFNMMLFSVGCILVVVAGLANNLLPLARPGVPKQSVVRVAMVVAMIFCLVLLTAILAAHLYGVLFLKPPDPTTFSGRIQLNAAPWYMHPLTWTIAAIAATLAVLISWQARRGARGGR